MAARSKPHRSSEIRFERSARTAKFLTYVSRCSAADEQPSRERRDVCLLLTARGMRAFGDGFVSILLPVYLTDLGFGAFEVGVLTTAMLLGPTMMTVAIGLIAHRLRTVVLLTGATMLMMLSGIGYAFETGFWPLRRICSTSPLVRSRTRPISVGVGLRPISPSSWRSVRMILFSFSTT